MAAIATPIPTIATEVFAIPYEDAYIVYAPLRRLAFVASAGAVDTMARLKQGALSDPTEEEATFIRFLDALGLTRAEGDRPIYGLHQARYKPNEVTLFLTTACNLRCVYCYARAGEAVGERMTMETAKRGIDYVVGNALDLGLGWFGLNYHGGGEPTINHAVLLESHAYASSLAAQHALKLQSSIATNGVLSPRIRDWMIAHLDGASVSLDGPPALNDLNRPTVNGLGSGARVMETLRAFDEVDFKYGVRITITARTVREMPEIVRTILERSHPVKLQIEPVYDIGRGQRADLHVESEAFLQGYLESWEIARAHRVPLDYSSARIDTLTSRFCRAYGEGFSVTPKGNVSGCFEVYDETADFAEDVIFGSFDEVAGSYSFDDAKLAKLRAHDVMSQSWCDGCFARWHCSGDCPNKTRHASGGGEFAGMPSCEITRGIVLHQLVRKIANAGGTVWVERAQI